MEPNLFQAMQLSSWLAAPSAFSAPSEASQAISIYLIKGHQPAGSKAGVQRRAQGLTPAAKESLARLLAIPAAAQA